MAQNYNIQMQYYNGSSYDTLNPKTTASQVIYNSSNLDTTITNMQNTVDDLVPVKEQLGSLNFKKIFSTNVNFLGNQSVQVSNFAPNSLSNLIFISFVFNIKEIRNIGGLWLSQYTGTSTSATSKFADISGVGNYGITLGKHIVNDNVRITGSNNLLTITFSNSTNEVNGDSFEVTQNIPVYCVARGGGSGNMDLTCYGFFVE